MVLSATGEGSLPYPRAAWRLDSSMPQWNLMRLRSGGTHGQEATRGVIGGSHGAGTEQVS